MLARFADDSRTPGVLASLARREAPSTLRAAGTLGGMVAAADAESELLAGLLAYDAVVTIVDGSGSADRALSAVLGGAVEGIITSVAVAADGVAAAARTARTPSDRAIVSAVARVPAGGDVRLALSGVAETPLLVEDVSALEPPGDFRGSASYRKHLAAVLAARVLGEVAAS
jgi:carbon-monoxide dehydrogenase medium subunit/putative selenate reductase FAD-binding subunit